MRHATLAALCAATLLLPAGPAAAKYDIADDVRMRGTPMVFERTAGCRDLLLSKDGDGAVYRLAGILCARTPDDDPRPGDPPGPPPTAQDPGESDGQAVMNALVRRGETVYVDFDEVRRDRRGFIVIYVWLKNGDLLNALLVREKAARPDEKARQRKFADIIRDAAAVGGDATPGRDYWK